MRRGSPVVAWLPDSDQPNRRQVRLDLTDAAEREVAGEPTAGSDDAPAGASRRPRGGSLTIHLGEPTEGERLFAALAEGGTPQIPIQERHRARRPGVVTDRFLAPRNVNGEAPARHAAGASKCCASVAKR